MLHLSPSVEDAMRTPPLVCCLAAALLNSASLATQDNSEAPPRHASTPPVNPLITSGVVPDVIKHVPEGVVNANYSNAAVPMGNTIPPQEATDKPTVSFDAKGGRALYTLVMVDPDAPSRSHPTYRSWLHWLKVNLENSELSGGDEAVSYIGPAPPQGSGPHRYVLLVVPQNGKRLDKAKVTYSDRRSFNFEMFLRNNSLPQPVAANFFYSENLPSGRAKSG